ncbi:MAG: DsbA family protein [Patulibacter sp.]
MALECSLHDPGEPPEVAFYYDFASPESYIALERLATALAKQTPELTPIHAAALPQHRPLAAGDDARRAALERLGDAHGLLPFAWPPLTTGLDSADAVTVATFAKSIGKVAAFSLALFRQIYAGGRDPATRDTLTLAAAAAEIHPRAVEQALTRSRPAADADAATRAALAAGVTRVPALRIGNRLLDGPSLLDLTDRSPT